MSCERVHNTKLLGPAIRAVIRTTRSTARARIFLKLPRQGAWTFRTSSGGFSGEEIGVGSPTLNQSPALILVCAVAKCWDAPSPLGQVDLGGPDLKKPQA